MLNMLLILVSSCAIFPLFRVITRKILNIEPILNHKLDDSNASGRHFWNFIDGKIPDEI